MDEEVFYSLDDEASLDHKIGSVISHKNPFSTNDLKTIKEKQEDENIFFSKKISKNNLNTENNTENIQNDNLITSNKIEEIQFKKKTIDKFYDEAYNSRRTTLPVPRKHVSLNIWGIIKDAVTKDLSKFCVPGK